MPNFAVPKKRNQKALQDAFGKSSLKASPANKKICEGLHGRLHNAYGHLRKALQRTAKPQWIKELLLTVTGKEAGDGSYEEEEEVDEEEEEGEEEEQDEEREIHGTDTEEETCKIRQIELACKKTITALNIYVWL